MINDFDVPMTEGQGSAPAPRATPCFTPGTLITTQRGEVPVEMLASGDRVVTRDNGIQPVRWVGKTQMFLHDFQADPHLLPVFIQQGSLGKGLPERDMMVSPNHRVLVTNSRVSVR
jgi:Hint domain